MVTSPRHLGSSKRVRLTDTPNDTLLESGLDYNEHTVMDAWEKYLDGDQKKAEISNVRSVIQESWQRSLSKGINAQNERSNYNLDIDQIEFRKENCNNLLNASRSIFSNIGARLHGTKAMLLLTDQEGAIIDAIGDKSTLNAGRDISLEIGSVWNENVVGTNGIGTAISTGKPVFVHAAEHFCLGIKAWTCAGAPIHDPVDGNVIGVIDLSGPSEIFQPHTAALIAGAAREIEEALAEFSYKKRLKLLEAFFSNMKRIEDNDGLILLDEKGRIAFSQHNSSTQNNILSQQDIHRGRQLIDVNKNMSSSDIYLALPKELRHCSINIINKDGLQGAMLVYERQLKKPSIRKTEINYKKTVSKNSAPEIIGNSQALIDAIDKIQKLANYSANTALLIEGETGVGKELFAKLVHAEISKSKKAPFVVLNCGAVSKELFGGELFGHVSGSFTGALKEGKAGKFELADGGVLCLDEIGEMPLDIQPYLLRVLEDRTVHRIGSEKGKKIDVKLVASTNRTLKSEVEKGTFRQDLYYRISSVTIKIPALRERGEDIILLAEHFNQKMSDETGYTPLIFTADVQKVMLEYQWPGNVRELKNFVENLHILLSHREVCLDDLPDEMVSRPITVTKYSMMQEENIPVHFSEDTAQELRGTPGGNPLEQMERETITRVIREENGNLTKAARILGISRPTLYRKLEIHNIKRKFS